MKKISAIFSVVALAFAFSASFALASSPRPSQCCNENERHSNTCCPSVTVTNNDSAITTNILHSSSSTGGNEITSTSSKPHLFSFWGGSTGTAVIVSGPADSWAHATTNANLSTTTIAAPSTGAVTVNNSGHAVTLNSLSSRATTGHNSISGSGNASIYSGSALDEASAMTLVNSHVTTITH